MKKKSILENAVIINGEVYDLIEDDLGDECERCDLQGYCKDGGTYLCDILYDAPNQRYQHIGTIEEVMAQQKKRKLARHHIAVLMQYKRWIRSDASLDIVRCPSIFDKAEAITFAIQELKEKYK